jgi:hypothetical protein
MAFDVSSVWTGATTDTSVQVKARLTAATSSTLLVADNEAMTGAVTLGPTAPGADNVIVWDVTGLDPGTPYWFVVDDGALNTSFKATARTHPVPAGEPASYIFGAAGDAGLTGDGYDGYITGAVSNSPVFDTMREQGAAEQWLWFSHLGDLHYKNISTNDPSLFRSAYFENMNFGVVVNPARQSQFFRSLASTYVWDDHDFGPNNSDRTSASNAAANQVYREWVPHYPLPSASAIYQSWQVGRVLYIASDVRSARDPNSDPQTTAKTLLGSAQKTWMEGLLSTARDNGAEALVWQSPSRWVGGTDTWSDFLHERAEMVQLFGDTGWLDRMIMLTADMHALSICSGPHNPHGRFPMFMFAGMDSGAWSTSETDYDIGSIAGRRQYGTMRVTDNGHTIALTGTGYHDGTALMRHTAYVHAGNPVWALDGTTGGKGDIAPPFRPVLDDQGVRNEITARREDGGEYTYADTDHIAAKGRRNADITVNVATDAQLPDQASWRVRLGTVPGMRYPSLSPALNVRPELVEQWLATELGDAGTVTGLPPQHPPDPVDLIAEGYTETIQPHRWDVTANTSPAAPYTVLQLVDDSGVGDTVEDFEDTDLTITVTDAGDLPWERTNTQAHTGSWSLRSGAITDNQASDAIVTIPAGTSTLTFWYRTSSEDDGPGFEGDRLLVLVDGAQVLRAQGETAWTEFTTDVTDASQVTFRYAKDNSAASGEDAVYIDDLTLTVPLSYAAGTDRPNRLQTSASHLTDAVDTDDTEFLIHTPPGGIFERTPWIISAGLADAPHLKPTHFPFDLRLGGEKVRATALAPFAYDSFTRSVGAGSWGTSDGGQAWTLDSGTASERSVDGTRGLVALPSTPATFRLQTLPGSVTDCEIRARLSVDQVATGDSLLPGVLMRYTSATDFYRARIHFGLTGALSVSVTRGSTQIGSAVTLPHTYTAGDEFEIRARLIGHRILARVWRTGAREPQIWHCDETVSSSTIAAGQIGTTASAFSGNTNVSPVCRFDAFDVITPQRATVTRSLNTVSKAHTAGTPIELARPAGPGL